MTDYSSEDVDLASVAIGHALAGWSTVEIGLARLFCIMSDIPKMDTALAVVDTIVSFEIRLQVCNSLMRIEAASELEKCMWEKFSAKLMKLYKRRHRIAHFSFVRRSDKLGDFRGYIGPFFNNSAIVSEDVELLGVPEIEELDKRFMQARVTTHWFLGEAAKRRGVSDLLIRPEPEQVQNLRDLAVQTLEARALPPRDSSKG